MFRHLLTTCFLFLQILFVSAKIVQANEVTDQKSSTGISEISFEKEISPILMKHCSDCHGPEAREGGLRFTNRKDLLLRNDSGEPAVVVGKSGESVLIHRVTSKDDDERMPPVDEGEPLSEKEIALLKKWIDSGANWPESGLQKKHWSYIKPERSELPEIQNKNWPQNEIDHFVLARMEQLEKPFSPSEREEPAKLLRKVYLDLIGLPPSPEEVDEFLASPTQEKYNEIVDRLLKSPRYGEKWARQWLDLARYADSNGFQADQIRTMWLFRDWVIKAINEDMPFDQFTIEQIAGDLLPKPTLSQKIATGFHRCTVCNVEAGVDPEENRTDQVIDRVNTTGTVWLGTSLECAQCHNHKYDPFTQQDYYQIFAFFNNTPLEVTQQDMSVSFNLSGPKLVMPMPEEDEKKLANLNKKKRSLNRNLSKRKKELSESLTKWESKLLEQSKDQADKKIPKSITEILSVESSKRSEKQKTSLMEYYVEQDELCSKINKNIKQIDGKIQELQPDSSLVMVEMTEPRMTNIFKRGVFLDKGPKVERAVPDQLHPLPEKAPENRLGFARWLVSSDNPLVARVTVNRWWNEFFGRGIVTTLEDFGMQGEKPTHPKLLDWLAVEFMENGWSMKQIHKLIVTSATYQQSSKLTDEKLSADPDNVYLSRGPRVRLTAEAIRDNALAISGLISTKMYGPPIFPPQPENIWRHVGRGAPVYKTEEDENRYRRGIYVIWRRSAPYPSFTNFDAPDRGSCIVKRSRTNTPLQALTLLNDPAYVEFAHGLAKRLLTYKPNETTSDRDRVVHAFRLAVSRQPTDEEVSLMLGVFQEEMERLKEQPKAAEELVPEKFRLKSVEISRQAAWFYISNILLNLDETITKG